MKKYFLVVGGTGSIGSYISQKIAHSDAEAVVFRTTTSRCSVDTENHLFLLRSDPAYFLPDFEECCHHGQWRDRVFDGIVWAHGMNHKDDIASSDDCLVQEMFTVNVQFILSLCRALLDHGHLSPVSCNLVIISSIYETRSRPTKLSYTVTKSALGGVVRALACDPSMKNTLINAVCPGPIDNEMTTRTLRPEQIERIRDMTFRGRLVSLDDIWNCVRFLLFENTGLNGQSLVVDLGLSLFLAY